MKYVITREKRTVLNLPDEIIERIVSSISSVDLCLSGWETVSEGFGIMIDSILSKRKVLDTLFGEDRFFFSKVVNSDMASNKSLYLQLSLVARKLFVHITSLTVSSSVFFALIHVTPFVTDRTILLPSLHCLNLFIGPGFDGVPQQYITFCAYHLAKSFASSIQAVKITARLMEGNDHLLNVSLFRELLKAVSFSASFSASWSLCLKDATQRAQSWFCPSELAHARNIAFISYVRLFTEEHGIHLKELLLIDELKVSPYMMVMKRKHRFLFMYDEFKECEKLSLQYDVGNVATSIKREIYFYSMLKTVEIVASHVLYKNEFLAYLSDALNLEFVQIVLPLRWKERVKRCAHGCFRNADFGCFTESGWASSSKFLPQAHLIVRS